MAWHRIGKRRQTIIWANDYTVHWRKYAELGGDWLVKQNNKIISKILERQVYINTLSLATEGNYIVLNMTYVSYWYWFILSDVPGMLILAYIDRAWI